MGLLQNQNTAFSTNVCLKLNKQLDAALALVTAKNIISGRRIKQRN